MKGNELPQDVADFLVELADVTAEHCDIGGQLVSWVAETAQRLIKEHLPQVVVTAEPTADGCLYEAHLGKDPDFIRKVDEITGVNRRIVATYPHLKAFAADYPSHAAFFKPGVSSVHWLADCE